MRDRVVNFGDSLKTAVLKPFAAVCRIALYIRPRARSRRTYVRAVLRTSSNADDPHLAKLAKLAKLATQPPLGGETWL